MILLSYIFVTGGTIFCLYSFYSCLVRYLKIKNLPSEIINEEDKDKYLKTIYKYCLYTGICTFLSLLSIVFKSIEARMAIPVITIIITSFFFQTLIDEIIDFDISKKDSDILFDFLKNRNQEATEKAKENKIKKIDSFNKKDLENEKEEV